MDQGDSLAALASGVLSGTWCCRSLHLGATSWASGCKPRLPLPVPARAVHRLLEHRHHGVAWPTTQLPVTQLCSAILRRVNEASGLYQMFGVLTDIVLLHE